MVYVFDNTSIGGSGFAAAADTQQRIDDNLVTQPSLGALHAQTGGFCLFAGGQGIAAQLFFGRHPYDLHRNPQALGKKGHPVAVTAVIALAANDTDAAETGMKRHKRIQGKLCRSPHQYVAPEAHTAR